MNFLTSLNSTNLKKFLTAFVSFIFFDVIWLGFVMKDFNMTQLKDIGRIENGVFQMQLIPALVTYLLMSLGVVVYILPTLEALNSKATPLKAFLWGAPMGLVVYGVFDTTNLSILKNYPLAFVVPDIMWGTFVFGIVTMICHRLTRNLNEK